VILTFSIYKIIKAILMKWSDNPLCCCLRLLVIAFIIGYVVWKINNKLLGKNLKLAQVIAATLVVTSLVYLVLGNAIHIYSEITR
jgi:hypothetical protein